MLRTC